MAGTDTSATVGALVEPLAELLERAGRIARAGFSDGAGADAKADGSPVTSVDRDIDSLLRTELSQLLPDAGWISEESAASPSRRSCDWVWIVDPLDGTKEFVRGVPEFAISIGLVHDGTCVLGGVANPITGEVGVGAVGGALVFRGGPAPAAAASNLESATVSVSRSELADGSIVPYADLAGHVTPIGSVAYKLLRVAAGVEHLTMSVQPKSEWDICGGVALVTAAGGSYQRLDGEPLEFNQLDTRIPSGAVAGQASLVAALRDRIRERERELALIEARFGDALRDLSNYLVEEGYRGFNLVRHGRLFIAIAQTIGAIDPARISPEAVERFRRDDMWIEHPTLAGLKVEVDTSGYDGTPRIVDTGYRGFNLVRRPGGFIAAAQVLGALDLAEPDPEMVGDAGREGMWLEHETLDGLRGLVDTIGYDGTYQVMNDGYCGFNLIRRPGGFIGVAQTLGGLELAGLEPERIETLKRERLWHEAPTLDALADRIAALGYHPSPDVIEEGYRGFNIIAHGFRVYAMALVLGRLDFGSLDDAQIGELIARKRCYVADTVDGIHEALDSLTYWPNPALLEESYRGFSLVGCEDRVHGVSRRLGPIDVAHTTTDDLQRHIAAGAWVIAADLSAAKRAVDEALARRRT